MEEVDGMPNHQELMTKLTEEITSREYSYQTKTIYTSVVKRFLDSGKNPKDFLFSYSDKSPSTIRVVYFALQFYHENVLHKKFDERVPQIRREKKLPVVLDKEEIAEMVGVTKNQKHRLVLMLLYYAGLRLHEVIDLQWEDIDFEKDLIHIKKEKDERERNVFLHPKLEQMLTVYGKKAHGPILMSNRNKKYHKKTIQQIVRRTSEKGKVRKRVTPNTLRHSFATHLLASGADIRDIQQLLGHKNLQTTRIYAHLASKDIKKLAALL